MSSSADLGGDLHRETELLDESFSKESDRGVALVTSAFFDATLERLLRARFSSRAGKSMGLMEPLFDSFGPLSSFSAKIRFAYAIDLLQDWIASDLDLIRRIRNEFSHTFELATFTNPAVTQRVQQLQGYDRALKSLKAAAEKDGKPFAVPPVPERMQSRWKFDLTCARIGALLQAKVIVQHSEASEEFKRSFMMNSAL